MGRSITRRIIEEHGGTITIRLPTEDSHAHGK